VSRPPGIIFSRREISEDHCVGRHGNKYAPKLDGSSFPSLDVAFPPGKSARHFDFQSLIKENEKDRFAGSR